MAVAPGGLPSGDPRIGELLPGDIPDVVDLWEETGLTRPWNDPEADLRRALEGPSSAVLVSRRGSGVSGTVMVDTTGTGGGCTTSRSAVPSRGVGSAVRC